MNEMNQNCKKYDPACGMREAGVCADSAREASPEQDELWALVKGLPEEVFEAEPSKKLDAAIREAAREAARRHMRRAFPPFLLWMAGAAAAFALSFIVLLHNHGQSASMGGETASASRLEAAASDWDMSDLYLELSDISGSFLETESKMSLTGLSHATEAELVFSDWQSDELY